MCSVAVIFFIGSCSGRESTLNEARNDVNGIVRVMKIVSTEEGKLSWKLDADSLISGLNDTNDVYGIYLEFFDEKGVSNSTISADSGKQAVSTQDMFASGDLVIDLYESGFRKWRIKADSVWQRQRIRRVDIYGMDLLMTDSAGKDVAVITADSGTYFLTTRDLRAKGSLVIKILSGGELSTDTLYYSESKGIFSTDGRVVYAERDNIMEGIGFESDRELKNIRVFNAVSGRIKTDEL